MFHIRVNLTIISTKSKIQFNLYTERSREIHLICFTVRTAAENAENGLLGPAVFSKLP